MTKPKLGLIFKLLAVIIVAITICLPASAVQPSESRIAAKFSPDEPLFKHMEGSIHAFLPAIGQKPKYLQNPVQNGKLYVIPSGRSIGVRLKSKGVMVVGYHLVAAKNGNVSPAEDANLRLGDNILKLNGVMVEGSEDFASIANACGNAKKKVKFSYLRGGKEYQTEVTPTYNVKEKAYQLGVYVRNFAAGIGTLTFYEPTHGVYGALGHAITDADTSKPLIVGSGTIFRSSIKSIEKGQAGEPGEKRGIFVQEHNVVGNILKNTSFGIFGQMESLSDNLEASNLEKAVPIATPQQVKEGPAKILTVVEGDKVESFDIEIVEASSQPTIAPKGLVIKVTDPKLLKRTGGIVQGMSGSPILQSGMLIGAVTHVLVNDPTSGYGTYIKWMIDQTDLNNFLKSA